MNKEISITINGEVYQDSVPIRLLLVDFIRDVAGLTGTHVGCTFEGVCGACTVQLDGEAVKSCLMLAVQADGRSITTIEGLAVDGKLHPLQKAFNDHHALQCGFCTTGILMSLDALLARHPDADAVAIRDVLTGHLCRCTGYAPIVKAALEAAAELRGTINCEPIDA